MERNEPRIPAHRRLQRTGFLGYEWQPLLGSLLGLHASDQLTSIECVFAHGLATVSRMATNVRDL
jgi:hypothetical protein